MSLFLLDKKYYDKYRNEEFHKRIKNGNITLKAICVIEWLYIKCSTDNIKNIFCWF